MIAKRRCKCTLVDDHNTSNRKLDFNVGHNETNEIASSEDDISSCEVSEEGPPFGVDSPGCSTTPLHNNGVLTPGCETADASNKRKSKVIVSESSRSPSPIPRTITKIDMIVLAQVWILEVVVVEMAVLGNVVEESVLVEVDVVESKQGVVDCVIVRVGADLAEDVVVELVNN